MDTSKARWKLDVAGLPPPKSSSSCHLRFFKVSASGRWIYVGFFISKSKLLEYPKWTGFFFVELAVTWRIIPFSKWLITHDPPSRVQVGSKTLPDKKLTAKQPTPTRLSLPLAPFEERIRLPVASHFFRRRKFMWGFVKLIQTQTKKLPENPKGMAEICFGNGL